MSKRNISNAMLSIPASNANVSGILPKTPNKAKTLVTRMAGVMQTLLTPKEQAIAHMPNEGPADIKGVINSRNTRLRLAESEILGRISLS